MSIVDELVANPGLYVGVDDVQDSELRGAARILVTPLPGNAGVTLDYEVLNPANEPIRGHSERTVIARTHSSGNVMVIGHTHADSVAILYETEPGTFELGPDGSRFPMKVVVTMSEPGHLRHSWWYGRPGDEPIERDVAEVVRIS
jgi:hypothetical protein